jgi:50S ribosomal protein L16 3-hydroxylase
MRMNRAVTTGAIMGAQPISDFRFDQSDESWQQTQASEFALPAEFWQDFITNYWEKKPMVIKQPFSSLLASSEELFQALVKASDYFRAGDRNANMRFHRNHALLMANVGKHIPFSEDGSIQGYAERLVQRMDCEKFDVMINHLQVHNADLWLRLREFFRPMYESLGFLPNNTEVVLFLRNYKTTARGLHKDSASVFLFVIEGHKRIITWPNEYFREKPEVWETLDYDRHLDNAIVLDGRPGDILYWPASYWHVGESDEQLSLSLSVGLHLKYKPSEALLEQVTQAVESQFMASGTDNYPFDPNNPQQSAAALPHMTEALNSTLKELEDSQQLAQTLKLAWLKRVTGYSFPKVPLPLPARKLADGETVRGQKKYPIVWSDWSDGQMAISANGHPFVAKTGVNVVELLTRINSGEEFQVSQLIHSSIEGDNESEAEFLRSLLEKLYTLRAVILTSNEWSGEVLSSKAGLPRRP